MTPKQDSSGAKNSADRSSRIAGRSPQGHDVYRQRLFLVTALLIASLGMNLCLARLPHRAQGGMHVAPTGRTRPAAPVTGTTSHAPYDLKVVHMPRYEYWFQWRRGNREKQEWGDVLSVYSVNDPLGRKPVFRQLLEGTFVSEILPWTIPEGQEEGPNAFMVVSNYAAGSSLHYAIFAEIHGRMRQVLDVFNGHAWYGEPLEVVKLDDDNGPEIISIDDYRLIGKNDQTARVWKWSPVQSRYVQVRVSSYADRLKPLSAKRSGAL